MGENLDLSSSLNLIKIFSVCTAVQTENILIKLRDEERSRFSPTTSICYFLSFADGKLGKYRVYKGDTIIVGAYAIHKNPKWWKNPDEFNPDRFKDAKSIHTFAHVPFSVGLRQCIGQQVSFMVMKVALWAMYLVILSMSYCEVFQR